MGPTLDWPEGAAPPGVRVRHRRWWLAAAVVLLVGIVGLGLVAVVVRRSAAPGTDAREGGRAGPDSLVLNGTVRAAGRVVVHEFAGAAGEQVFVEIARHDAPVASVPLRLLDPDGQEIASGCFGCGHLGRQVLRHAGRYRIVAGDERTTATGGYELRVHRVPRPAPLPIALDQPIAPDRPAAGAGLLRVPGERDIYVFDAPAGTRIFVETLKHDLPVAQVGLALVGPDDRTIASGCLGCGSLGFQTLAREGRYQLVVGSERDTGTGAYELRLHRVPPTTTTAIALDPEGRVTPVTDRIDVPGEERAYAFEVAARGEVFVRSARSEASAAQANVALVDPDGREVVRRCLGCGDVGLQSLARPGTYRIVVFDRVGATGAFEIRLNAVPAPVEYPVRLGGRIGPDVPGPGAGFIAIPGERDVYVFRGSRGQRVRIEGRPRDGALGYLAVQLLAAGGDEIAQGLADSGVDATLPADGAYRVVVRAGQSGGTGAYEVRLRAASG